MASNTDPFLPPFVQDSEPSWDNMNDEMTSMFDNAMPDTMSNDRNIFEHITFPSSPAPSSFNVDSPGKIGTPRNDSKIYAPSSLKPRSNPSSASPESSSQDSSSDSSSRRKRKNSSSLSAISEQKPHTKSSTDVRTVDSKLINPNQKFRTSNFSFPRSTPGIEQLEQGISAMSNDFDFESAASSPGLLFGEATAASTPQFAPPIMTTTNTIPAQAQYNHSVSHRSPPSKISC